MQIHGFFFVNFSALRASHVSFQQAVEPWQEILGAVVRVEDHGHAVLLGHGPHVVGATHGARDGCVELRVVQALPGIEPRRVSLSCLELSYYT